MNESTRAERESGAMLKDLALRSAPAFPDFEALFEKRQGKTNRRIRAAALTLGLAAGIVAGFGAGMFARGQASSAREETLIDSWGSDDPYRSNVSSPQYLATYIQDLWESSSRDAATNGH